MRAADQTEYIVQCIREAGSMYEDDARAFLAEHDAHVRAEVLTELAAKANQRMAVGTSRLVTKTTVRHFLELEASAARKAATRAATTRDDTPAADAPDPEIAADTARRAQLLYAMATQGGHWKSGRVLRWYALHGYEGLGVRDARQDLAALRDRGHIHQHDASGCRFFTTSLTNKGES
ncbi:hypothetical protein [Streptomyces coelicoflavus]|uniref:hypothetical protein n=1 Tax=Streptomyces coelicoflavus TaxID=285562 RepID=UPI000D59F3AE|nr:hypothetical protein [Streptomyces coelicoflavus]